MKLVSVFSVLQFEDGFESSCFICSCQKLSRVRRVKANTLTSIDVFIDDGCSEVSHTIVHFFRFRSLDILNSLPLIGGYSWWQTDDGYNARAWFLKEV